MPAYQQDQADQYWCPFVRGSGIGGPYNRPGPLATMTEDVTAASCIGSACSAWRWLNPANTIPTSIGFCGLAGRP